MSAGSGDVTISVRDLAEACTRQKCGKAVGLEGIAMKAFIHGGHRLHVHLCLLFNMFVRSGYVPDLFMNSVIIPLVKCKMGKLSDVNIYRAIAISSAISKLFESVFSVFIKLEDYFDCYQFGFTAGCSTSLCTNVFKNTVDSYRLRGSHVFVSFLDFSKAFDKLSYWKFVSVGITACVNSSLLATVPDREAFCHRGCLHVTLGTYWLRLLYQRLAVTLVGHSLTS